MLLVEKFWLAISMNLFTDVNIPINRPSMYIYIYSKCSGCSTLGFSSMVASIVGTELHYYLLLREICWWIINWCLSLLHNISSDIHPYIFNFRDYILDTSSFLLSQHCWLPVQRVLFSPFSLKFFVCLHL